MKSKILTKVCFITLGALLLTGCVGVEEKDSQETENYDVSAEDAEDTQIEETQEIEETDTSSQEEDEEKDKQITGGEMDPGETASVQTADISSETSSAAEETAPSETPIPQEEAVASETPIPQEEAVVSDEVIAQEDLAELEIQEENYVQEYDIDSYCRNLEEQYQDINLAANVLFEDDGLVLMGISYTASDEEGETKLSVAHPRTTAGSDKTINDYLCGKCGGEGVILTSYVDRQVCPICNGSGMQYIPNAIYDTVMGWMGQYVGCGGCGCSGYVEYTREYYDWCDQCNGYGVALQL